LRHPDPQDRRRRYERHGRDPAIVHRVSILAAPAIGEPTRQSGNQNLPFLIAPYSIESDKLPARH
jgi:hypothetical protein